VSEDAAGPSHIDKHHNAPFCDERLLAGSGEYSRISRRYTAAANGAETAMATNSVAAVTNKAIERRTPTLAETVLPPSTECAGNLVRAGKLVKDAKFMALNDPSLISLESVHFRSLVGKGNKWVITNGRLSRGTTGLNLSSNPLAHSSPPDGSDDTSNDRYGPINRPLAPMRNGTLVFADRPSRRLPERQRR
jgi:hypothetical protein